MTPIGVKWVTCEPADMVPSLRTVFFGNGQSPRQRYLLLSLSVVLSGVTFAAYALNFFAVSGGVVFIPGHAALVGVLGAGWIGYRRSGLIVAWLASYGALLGYSAEHSFLGLSGRSFLERAGAFFQLEGLVVWGIEALIFGTLGFLIGVFCNWVITAARNNTMHSEAR